MSTVSRRRSSAIAARATSSGSVPASRVPGGPRAGPQRPGHAGAPEQDEAGVDDGDEDARDQRLAARAHGPHGQPGTPGDQGQVDDIGAGHGPRVGSRTLDARRPRGGCRVVPPTPGPVRRGGRTDSDSPLASEPRPGSRTHGRQRTPCSSHPTTAGRSSGPWPRPRSRSRRRDARRDGRPVALLRGVRPAGARGGRQPRPRPGVRGAGGRPGPGGRPLPLDQRRRPGRPLGGPGQPRRADRRIRPRGTGDRSSQRLGSVSRTRRGRDGGVHRHDPRSLILGLACWNRSSRIEWRFSR